MKISSTPLLFCGLTIFSMAACSDSSTQKKIVVVPPQPECLTGDQSANLTYTPTWTGSVGSILTNYCQACHGPAYSTYNAVKANISSAQGSHNIMNQIVSGGMPQRRQMSPQDKSTLQLWVSVGMPYQDTAAPQSPANPSTSPSSTQASTPGTTPTGSTTNNTNNCDQTTTAVSFAKDIQPIMSAYCLYCHSSSGGRSPYLDSYASVKSNFSSILRSVTSGSMPLNTNTKVPSDKITLLRNWGSTNFNQ